MARVRIKTTSSSRVVYLALAGNALVAVSKFVAAAVTGSSAMLSEGFHSVVDTLNQVLLLYGMHRGRKKADDEHPLGYGREIYFWSFVVALLLFTAGAGASIYEGIVHIMHPHPIENPLVTYIVLGLATLFEGSSWVYALKNVKGKRKYSEVFGLIVRSKDPPTFIVLLEDSAALMGILIAFLGVYFSVTLQLPVLDGLASIFIGITLGLTALLLTRETKGLLIGESPGKNVRESILRIAGQTPGIVRANNVVSVHVSPREIMAALSVEFEDALRAPEIEAVVINLENRIRAAMPEVTSVFVKPETSRSSDNSAAYPERDPTQRPG
ncbi:cation diffusion facilitator family transporter [Pusillimonas sp. ANT_WB101]|uniref:cation diffusion facilitator family transporter n=1 Tax=Pusillimonas sp. ANT_WB101 TaxID=2597356 RepID=UPI0011EE9994|nr:cation diffusion facilitator family transporter [Pusillimonas sp. ANT_WB101]KAA0911543.1 cation transporter [Pusillimonas sp. ANT_WB101]